MERDVRSIVSRKYPDLLTEISRITVHYINPAMMTVDILLSAPPLEGKDNLSFSEVKKIGEDIKVPSSPTTIMNTIWKDYIDRFFFQAEVMKLSEIVQFRTEWRREHCRENANIRLGDKVSIITPATWIIVTIT